MAGKQKVPILKRRKQKEQDTDKDLPSFASAALLGNSLDVHRLQGNRSVGIAFLLRKTGVLKCLLFHLYGLPTLRTHSSTTVRPPSMREQL